MNSGEIRKKFLLFFEQRGHAIVPSSSLVPEKDPTTLFTGSGMQPMIPYLLGEEHPAGSRVADSQKCFRAEDIEEVGDNRHTTFFEMLGNWSFGDYWKEEQLSWFFQLLTEDAGLDPRKLYITVFSGDEASGIPRDTETPEIWKRLFRAKGIEARDIELLTEENAARAGMQGGRIFYYGSKKNWWSRAGLPENMPAGEPGGPDSEVFYEFSQVVHDKKYGNECHPNCDCGRYLEIGNSVFMEYRKRTDGTFEKLKQRNVDFGGGLERIVAASNNNPDVFTIDIFQKLWEDFENEIGTGVPYAELPDGDELKKAFRIVADHIRASAFLISDGVEPGNKGRGYILRRLLRRAVFYMDYGKSADFLKRHWLEISIRAVAASYADSYPELAANVDKIVESAGRESKKFAASLKEGLREFEKFAEKKTLNENTFNLYQNFGLPWELTWELARLRGLKPDKNDFQKQFEIHREKSRTASAGVFKGGLADSSEKTTRLHTAHHLLLKALQIVLGKSVKQRGSNITRERLRIDISYGKKLSDDEKQEVERIVNEKIKEDLPVIRSEMEKEKAEALGAEHEFGQKYPDRVSIYSIGPKDATTEDPKFDEAFSIEFCGGPHVRHTGEIGTFRIAKEEAVGAGVRRVRGTVEP